MEWSDDKCLALIELYRKQTGLWNPKDDQFGYKKLKRDAWIEIGQNMNMPPMVCKNKMKILLSGYRREKAKLRQSEFYIRKGVTGSSVYRSQWFAFEAFSFLTDRDKPPQQQQRTVRKDLANDCLQTDKGQPSTEAPNIGQPSTETITTGQRTNPRLKCECADQTLSALKETTEILKAVSNKVNDDEITSFCKFLQYKLKSYDNPTKNLVQQELCQVIFKADAGNFNADSSITVLKTDLYQ